MKSSSLSENVSVALAIMYPGFVAHHSKDDWGEEILIMEIHGIAFCRIYWYYDDNSTAYLSWLSVNESERMKGIGTRLQELREEMARCLGATTCFLRVKENTWIQDWYQRRKYVYFERDNEDENYIWMKKQLI